MQITKHRTGHLLRRGHRYYVRYMIAGRLVQRVLKDEENNPVTDRRTAERIRDKIVAPIAVATDAEAIESLAARLQGRKAVLAELDEKAHPPLTASDAWESFSLSPARPDTGPGTLSRYRGQLARFTTWLGREHPDLQFLRDVTAAVAEAYAIHLQAASPTASTYNQHIGLLRLFWRVMAEKIRSTENPWMRIKRRRIVNQHRRELTVDELRAVCKAAAGELRVLLALGMYTGLRLGDCATLRWCEVDMRRAIIIRVPAKLARRESVKPLRIPIHPELMTILREQRTHAGDDEVLPMIANDYRTHADQLSRRISAHFVANGIQTVRPGTGEESRQRDEGGRIIRGTGSRAVVDVGFHSLRHTYITMLREAGAPLAVTTTLVGHHALKVHEGYTHVGDAALRSAVVALPPILSEKQVPSIPSESIPDALIARVHGLARRMSADNWQQVRDELLQIRSAAGPDNTLH